jgi:hypothetical protein
VSFLWAVGGFGFDHFDLYFVTRPKTSSLNPTHPRGAPLHWRKMRLLKILAELLFILWFLLALLFGLVNRLLELRHCG